MQQFDKKYLFDVHLSFVHGEKLDIKQEPDSQPSVICEATELEIKHQGEENTKKNESKRRKVSMKAASGHKGKGKFKCAICNEDFERQGHLNQHVETVHEGKKPLNRHVETIHDGKKPFKCDICNAKFTSNQSMKGHIATIHEGRKK